MPSDYASQPLVKSRRRVSDHGEVFTPDWMVDAMLDQVKDETERIGSRFLEPACGSGNFLAPALQRKLAAAGTRYAKSRFEFEHQALFALMSVYGIELLPDNIDECKTRLLEIFILFLGVNEQGDLGRAGRAVLDANLIHGDAMTMLTPAGAPIEFPEWAYLGRGKYQRRDFRLDNLSERSQVRGTLFDQFEEHEVFQPTRRYQPMTVKELAA